MKDRTMREAIGQVFRESGRVTNIVRVAGVSVAYKAGDKLELSRRDDFPSDAFIGAVQAAAAEYGVFVNLDAAVRTEDNAHDVRWCKVSWKLRTVKLDDVINGHMAGAAEAEGVAGGRAAADVRRLEDRQLRLL